MALKKLKAPRRKLDAERQVREARAEAWSKEVAGFKAQAEAIALRSPPGVVLQTVDPDSGLPADKGCRTLLPVPFVEGSVPERRAPCARTRSRSWFDGLF